MTSQKNKTEFLALSKGKSEKPAKLKKRKEKCNMPPAECNMGSQNFLNEGEKKLLVRFSSHSRSRKRKANEGESSRKMNIKNSRSQIMQEPDIANCSSSLSNENLSDSDLVVISETESSSCLSERICPSNNLSEVTKNYNFTEFCNENERFPSSINVNGLHPTAFNMKSPPSSFSVKSPPSVPSRQLASKITESDMSVLSGESSIILKENYKHRSFHSTFSHEDVLPEIEINANTNCRGLTNSDKVVCTAVENINSNPNSNIYQNTSLDTTKQCTTKDFVDCNSSFNPKQPYDILTLLTDRLNETENSKENFICNQLKIEPVIKPVDFNYDQNDPFNIVVDISMLKAANDYIRESLFKDSDFPGIASDIPLENSWQNSLLQPSDLSLNFENLIVNDSNQFNLEDAESEISISSCNTADIQPEFFEPTYSENLEGYSQENLNHTDNFVHSVDLNVGMNELMDNQLHNFSENVDLLNEINEENCIKMHTKGKRKRRRNNWYRKKQCKKRNTIMSKVNGMVKEESLCDTCDESELEENSFDSVPSEPCKQLLLNAYCLPTLPLLDKVNDNGLFNAAEEKSASCSTKKQRYKKKKTDTEESIHQILNEEAFCNTFDKDIEQYSEKVQVKECVTEVRKSVIANSHSQSNSLNVCTKTAITKNITNDVNIVKDLCSLQQENCNSSCSKQKDANNSVQLRKRKRNYENKSNGGKIPRSECNISDNVEENVFNDNNSSNDVNNKTAKRKLKKPNKCSDNLIEANVSQVKSTDSCRQMEINLNEQVEDIINSSTVKDKDYLFGNDCINSEELVSKKCLNNILKNKNIMIKSGDNVQLNIVKVKSKITGSTKKQKYNKKECTQIKDDKKILPQILDDETFCDTHNIDEQFHKNDQEKICMSETGTGIKVNTHSKMNSDNLGSLLQVEFNTFCDTPNTSDPAVLCKKRYDNYSAEICEKNAETACNLSFDDEKNTCNLNSSTEVNKNKKQKLKKIKSSNNAVKSEDGQIQCDSKDPDQHSESNYMVNPDKNSIHAEAYTELQELTVNKEHQIESLLTKTLVVNLQRLDEPTLNKYCKVFNYVQEQSTTSNDSSTEQGISFIAVNINDSNSLSDSEKKLVHAKNLQNDVLNSKITLSKESSNVSTDYKKQKKSIDIFKLTKHPENYLKLTGSPKATVMACEEKSNVLFKQKFHRFNEDSTCKEVDSNKNSKNCSSSVKKKSNEEGSKLSSSKMDSEKKTKIKTSGLKKNESSNSIQHLKSFPDAGKNESKNSKSKDSSNKNNVKDQSTCKKSVKLNSKNILPKNCNQTLPGKNLDSLNSVLFHNTNSLNNGSTFSKIVRNMKPIPKLSQKKKIEKSDSHVNRNKESQEDSSPQMKLTVNNSADLQTPSTQISNLKNNSDDISLKINEDITEAVILIDEEYLDFEPDQSDDLNVKHSVDNSVIESSCIEDKQVNSEIPVPCKQQMAINSTETPEIDVLHSGSSSVSKDNVIYNNNGELDIIQPVNFMPYVYNNLIQSRNFCTPPDKDLLFEDDSDSDNEHSFKRRRYERKSNEKQVEESSVDSVNLKNCKENLDNSTVVETEIHLYETEPRVPIEDCHVSVSVTNSVKSESFKSSCKDQVTNSLKGDQTNCLKSKVSAGSVASLKDVLAEIKDFCSKDSVNEAIEIAKTYIAISSIDINKRILRQLLSNIFLFILRSDRNNNSTFKILDDILNLIHDFNICDKQIASYFITKCCSLPDLNIYSIKLLQLCQKENIPLNSEAVNAFSMLLKSEEISLPELLDFLSYIKMICNKKVSKDLVHLALEKCEVCTFLDIHRMCSFLHNIKSKEVEESNLKEFLQLCFKKDLWQYVAEMFIAWGLKKTLSISIYTALAADYETTGKYFRKFANYVHEKEGSLCPELKSRFGPELKARFGQMGTALMMDAFSKSYMEIALDILYTLHTYNVNYFELQLALESSFLTQSCSEVDNYDLKIFPFSAVFTAIDVCLNLNRPKDAFTIFQDFSWVTPDEILNNPVRTYVVKERCQRLLKLVPLLNSEDSLNEGWEALEKLLTSIKDDSTLDIVQENVQDLVSIYNEYLISLLNSEKISSVYILYKYSLGPRKDIFKIFPDVLRGLVVAFSKDSRDAVAHSLFLLGVMTKVYPIQKPELENFPWEITLMTHWTSTEIKVAIEWFIRVLFPLLMDKPKETNFEKWFSVKIVFICAHQSTSDIKCLMETVSDLNHFVTKTKDILQTMNPSLDVTDVVNENTLSITSDSLYNFWKNRCPYAASIFTSMDMQFLKFCDKRFIFGGDGNNSERGESVFMKTFSNETYSLLKSPEILSETWNSAESLQEHSTSPECIMDKMTDGIRASTSELSCIATTPEQSPSGQNLVHGISSSESCFLSKDDTFLYRDKKFIKLRQQAQLSNMLAQNCSPNGLSDEAVSDQSPKHTSKSKRSSVSSVYQSPNKTEILNNSNNFQSLLKSNSNSLPSFSLASDYQSVSSIIDDSISNLNKSAKTNAVNNNTIPSSSKSFDLQQENSPGNQTKFSSYEKSLIPLNTPLLGSTVVGDILSSVSFTGLKKRKKKKVRKSAGKCLAAHSVANSKNLTPLNVSSVKAVQSITNSEILTPSPKTSVKIAQSLTISRKLTTSLKPSLMKASTVSGNKTPTTTPKLSVKKGKKIKFNKSSKEFQNFTVCVTTSARTVNSPLNQSLPAIPKTIQNDSKMNETNLADIQEKPSLSFHDKISVCNSTLNENLPAMSKSIENNVKMNESNLTNCKEKLYSSIHDKIRVSISPLNQSLNAASKSIQSTMRMNENNVSNTGKKSHSPLPLKISKTIENSVQLPAANLPEQKQDLNTLGTISQTASKAATSPNQSVDCVPKNKCTFTETINLKNTSNAKSSDFVAAINVSSPNSKHLQPKTSKPVIKRNLSTNLNENSVSSASTKSGTVVLSSNASLTPHSEKKTDLNKKFEARIELKENSEISRPVCGSSTCSDEAFNKIIQFLKVKVTLKNKNLCPEEQNKRALSLAQAFISDNQGIFGLDKKTMKLLTEFANLNA